ncbi:MAG: AraC family transcriptional regulator [Bacteroidetes bacterium]|nr:AraC family transcriptional regulator [Bacteroidota bacterium]
MSRFSFAQDDLYAFVENVFPLYHTKHKRAKEITDCILNRFPENIDEDEIAAELDVTKRWIQKVCTASFLITFTRLKRILRIYSALKLLHETNQDMLGISVYLDYSDETNMARDFRLELNISPTEARTMMMNKTPMELFGKRWRR